MRKSKSRCPLPAMYLLTIAGLLCAVLWGSRAVTTLSENLPIQRAHCFVIDAGHGGEDGGASSCTGKLESGINLEIALRLDDLMHFLGCDTRMIRTTDTAIYTKGESLSQKKASDLKERVRIVNETEGAILLSIHQNNFSDSRYSGAQVFYAKTEGSQFLAKQLQDALVNTLNPDSSRKAKPSDGVYLMEHIQSPGVLIECGFLSNPEEEAKLTAAAYQKQLCCVIAATVLAYANT